MPVLRITDEGTFNILDARALRGIILRELRQNINGVNVVDLIRIIRRNDPMYKYVELKVFTDVIRELVKNKEVTYNE